MVIRVATKDAESAKLLAVDLAWLLGEEGVSLQPDGEVHLKLRGGGNGDLEPTLKAVEQWLDETRTASAEVWVDERSYTVCAPAALRELARPLHRRSSSRQVVTKTNPRRGHNGTDDSGA
jgi:hypothetical protein